MKKNSMGMMMGIGALFLGGMAFADSRTIRVEIPLENVFAPMSGYDDNDNVEVVVHGFLPNGCYNLADTFVQPLADGVTYAVRQFATKITDGYCAQGERMPAHIEMMVPFSKTVSVGRLNAAEYHLQYRNTSGDTRQRTMSVAVAMSPAIDEAPYANVTNAAILDVYEGRQEVKAKLTGVLNSTCTEVSDEVQVRKQGDVWVVLPVLKVKPNVFCAQVLVPFAKNLNLGRMEPGEYLLHVRAMNGASVNRVFTVTK